MIYIVMNALPILVATLAGLAVGAAYLALTGRRGLPGLLATAFVAEFWLASILAGALILAPPNASPWVMAVGSAVVIWIGFVLPALLVTARARALAWGSALADGGHWLAVMLVQAVVMQAWGLARPPV